MQVKVDDTRVDKFKWYYETICLKKLKERWPSPWCHLDEVVLTLDRASTSEDLAKDLGEAIGHSYTPSLVSP